MPLGFIMTVADHRATGTGCAANPFRPSTVPDQLFGGNGHDTLLGGSGNGNDVLSGGAGSNWGTVTIPSTISHIGSVWLNSPFRPTWIASEKPLQPLRCRQ
jgi:hypothetical protein